MEGPLLESGENRLKAGTLGLLDAVVMSCAFIAPGMVMIFGNLFIAIWAGGAISLVYLLSGIVILTIAYCVGQLARKYPSAGAFYTYACKGLGPKSGFMTGWLLFAGWACLAPAQAAIFGSWLHDILARNGLGIPWPVLSLALLAVVCILSLLGIKLSMRLGLIGLVFEVTVVTILSVFIVAKGGAGGNTLQAFVPEAAFKGWNGITMGMVFAIWGFVGFEASAVLGEEVRDPKRTIPRAVMLSVIILGVYYVAVSYAESIGFGMSAAGTHAISTDPVAFDTLANRFAGVWVRFFIDIAALTSVFALNLATVNSISRVIYVMGRERLLPKVLGRTLRRYQTPHIAITAIIAFATAVCLIGGFAWGPLNAFGYIMFIGTLGMIAVYALINLSTMGVYWRNFRAEFSVLKHAVIPLIGIAALVWVLKGNVYPVPASPYDYFIYVVAAWALVGLGIAFWLSHKRPELMNKAGMILSGLEEDEAATQPRVTQPEELPQPVPVQ
jgi:amino acid transporter